VKIDQISGTYKKDETSVKGKKHRNKIRPGRIKVILENS
jgi:hypothetical protein